MQVISISDRGDDAALKKTVLRKTEVKLSTKQKLKRAKMAEKAENWNEKKLVHHVTKLTKVRSLKKAIKKDYS